MASHYGVVERTVSHYGSHSFGNGKRVEVPQEVSIGSKKIPFALLQRAISFLNPENWASLPFVSKAWYQAAKGKVFLLHFAKEEEAKGKQDNYTIKRHLTRQDASAIFAQTGLEISFTPGQAVIRDFRLGRGAFGEFCIGFAAKKAHYVGIKITRGRDASEREAQTQIALNGLPSIMPSRDICKAIDATGSPALYQVMELGGLGSTATLKKHLDCLVDQRLKEQVLFCIAEGLLVGLASMHSKGYYHLDIKPDNLVVRQDGQVYIIDFGCSINSASPLIDVCQTMGDQIYFSPERAHATALCDAAKIDAWAAGISLLLLGGFAPLPMINTFEQAEAARQAWLAQASVLTHTSGDVFLALIQALLHADPTKRLSPAQALQHPWILQMQKASVEWRADTVAYLREFVQSLHRETCNALSPQDLPLPHFSAYVERTALKDTLLKLLTSPVSYEKSVITVCQGMGGVGKTQFVTHLIHQRKVQTHFGLKLWFRSADNRSYTEITTKERST